MNVNDNSTCPKTQSFPFESQSYELLESSPMQMLNKELIAYIFEFLSGPQRAKIKPVSKEFDRIASSEQFSSLGNFNQLHIHLIENIFEKLLPIELIQLKTVSTKFNELASDALSMQPEYVIARKNLEMALPQLTTSSLETRWSFRRSSINRSLSLLLFLNSDGNLQAFKRSIGWIKPNSYIRGSKSGKFRKANHRKMAEIPANYHRLRLTWFVNLETNDKNKYGLGVEVLSRLDNPEVIKKITQYTYILANQYYDGATEIAKKNASDDRVNSARQLVAINNKKYPFNQILKAGKGIKHISG